MGESRRRTVKLTDSLRDAYESGTGSHLNETPWQRKLRASDRRKIARLSRRGIVTVGELISALPTLPFRTAYHAIWRLLNQAPQAAPTLWKLMARPELRIDCAHTLGMLGVQRFERKFVQLGHAELAMPQPDIKVLEAVFHGLRYATTYAAAEILIAMFERADLPGWLRGDVADALPSAGQVNDRRAKQFRRVLVTAIAGLDDADICMQFGSMYVLASLASRYGTQRDGRTNGVFQRALPRLREIATTDSRLSPGYWWPMSAEAEDVIGCIETGRWPQPDASERWLQNSNMRGEWKRES